MLFFVIIKSISLSLRQHKTHFITYRIKRAYVAFLLMFIFREFIFFVGSILTNIAGLQTFFAFVKALPCRYLLQTPSFFLRLKSGQIRSKLPFPATVPPALQSGTQGQTGRKKRRTFWLAYSFNTSIIFANMRFYFCLYYIYC